MEYIIKQLLSEPFVLITTGLIALLILIVVELELYLTDKKYYPERIYLFDNVIKLLRKSLNRLKLILSRSKDKKKEILETIEKQDIGSLLITQEREETDFEKKLAKLWSETEEDMKEAQYYRTMGKKEPIRLMIKKQLRDLYFNPFNSQSVPRTLLNCFLIGLIGGSLALFGLQNILFAIPLVPVFGMIPYVIVQNKISKNKLKVQEENLMLLTTFSGTYSESTDITAAFKKTALLYKPGSREYETLMSCRDLLSSVSLNIVLEKLKTGLLADEMVSIYIDTISACEFGTKSYKRCLSHIMIKYRELIRHNTTVLREYTLLMYCYIAGIFILLGFLIFYKYFDPVVSENIFNQFSGQALVFSLFIVYIIIGLFLQTLSTPIEFQHMRYIEGRDTK